MNTDYIIYSAHKDLCDIHKILHRDISFANIMMTPPLTLEGVDFDSRRQRALLIDFGYATKLNNKGDVDDSDRTVRTPILVSYIT
jgi:serine/threonine protein kinase